MDLPGVVQRTAQFLQCDLNNDQLTELCQHLSFDSMKSNPMTNLEDLKPNYKINLEGKMEPFMRKGKVGDWKSEIDDQLGEKIDKQVSQYIFRNILYSC
ncbi:hypothetical protein C0J52_08330 [Blattella germanica]|nr:hypothetical protein C0J52_08330 [Blattella germanica]